MLFFSSSRFFAPSGGPLAQAPGSSLLVGSALLRAVQQRRQATSAAAANANAFAARQVAAEPQLEPEPQPMEVDLAQRVRESGEW